MWAGYDTELVLLTDQRGKQCGFPWNLLLNDWTATVLRRVPRLARQYQNLLRTCRGSQSTLQARLGSAAGSASTAPVPASRM